MSAFDKLIANRVDKRIWSVPESIGYTSQVNTFRSRVMKTRTKFAKAWFKWIQVKSRNSMIYVLEKTIEYTDWIICTCTIAGSKHSHKKWKDSLEGSLDGSSIWVLFAAELEFPKILVPRPPQHISDVNIKCAGKSEWSKQLHSLHLTSFFRHWYILILLFWYQSVFNWWCLV